MRILITGDRNWNCRDIAERVLTSLRSRHGRGLTIVHGDATGVDAAFKTWCKRLGITAEAHPADWSNGPGGGPARNQTMVNKGADFAIAVHRQIQRSKGTRDCVRKCLDAGIAVYLIDGANPDRRIYDV